MPNKSQLSDRLHDQETRLELATQLSRYPMECTDIRLRTANGSIVRTDIRKHIAIDDENPRPLAKIWSYNYNANRPAEFGGTNLIRYDGPSIQEDPAHIDNPAHHKFHHKHVYTCDPPEIILLSEDNWPHVEEFLREVVRDY